MKLSAFASLVVVCVAALCLFANFSARERPRRWPKALRLRAIRSVALADPFERRPLGHRWVREAAHRSLMGCGRRALARTGPGTAAITATARTLRKRPSVHYPDTLDGGRVSTRHCGLPSSEAASKGNRSGPAIQADMANRGARRNDRRSDVSACDHTTPTLDRFMPRSARDVLTANDMWLMQEARGAHAPRRRTCEMATAISNGSKLRGACSWMPISTAMPRRARRKRVDQVHV